MILSWKYGIVYLKSHFTLYDLSKAKSFYISRKSKGGDLGETGSGLNAGKAL